MTAIVITKKTRQRSLVQWILPGFRSVTQELREVGERVFQFLLCEVEFPEHPKKRCYSRIKRQIIETLTQYGCQKVLIYDPVRTTLKRDLEECGFRAPDAGILKRLLFEKLLEFSIKKREKPVERAALVDYEGNFQSEELLYTLCKKFRYVTLVTTNPAYFERAAERVMEEMGLAIQITGDEKIEDSCGLYVLMSCGERTLYRYAKNREHIVLCMAEEVQMNFIGLRNVLRRPIVKLPQEFMQHFPTEITDTQVAELMATDGVEKLVDHIQIVGAD